MKKFIESTQYMRDAQKQYFKTMAQEDLLNAKIWERKVDEILFEIKVLIIKTPHEELHRALIKMMEMEEEPRGKKKGK